MILRLTVCSFALMSCLTSPALADEVADALQSALTAYTAGDMGSFTIGQDSTVVLGKPTVFDKSNIGQFDF